MTMAQTAFAEAAQPVGGLRIIVPGEPVPKARPRLGKGGVVFTPGKTKAWEASAKIVAKAAASRASWQTSTTTVGPRGGKTSTPHRYAVFVDVYRSSLAAGDLDNFMKAALDALNGVAFEDDRYVLQLAGKMQLSASPRVEIVVRRITV